MIGRAVRAMQGSGVAYGAGEMPSCHAWTRAGASHQSGAPPLFRATMV